MESIFACKFPPEGINYNAIEKIETKSSDAVSSKCLTLSNDIGDVENHERAARMTESLSSLYKKPHA